MATNKRSTETVARRHPGLSRRMGLLALTATGICSMLGASVFIVPFMIQRNVPGIGPYVIPAFALAAIPAILAAFSYAMLASAMPRAGGSYIYASRGLNPYLGFIASFSQWFGLSIVIGVIAYVIVPFIRDVADAIGWTSLAGMLELGWIRVLTALSILWAFVWVNIRGTKFYERTLIPLMIIMFLLGGVVIFTGFYFDQDNFVQQVMSREGRVLSVTRQQTLDIPTLLAASAVLFSSFIGFDSIAQAGGEAKNPTRLLPLSIGLTIAVVGSFYMLFTAAVYHAVPWSFIAEEALTKDLTAPGLLSYLLHPGWAVAILSGAAIALINDLPAMLLSVSRLMFAWSLDGIFPKIVSRIHGSFKTPHIALLCSGAMASIGIFGCHFAGDFFLGVDIMVTSMMVNFILMCLTVISIRRVNEPLARQIKFVKNRKIQLALAWVGITLLSFYLIIHLWKDWRADVEAWYFHSTPVYVIVMMIATVIFYIQYKNLQRNNHGQVEVFSDLPDE